MELYKNVALFCILLNLLLDLVAYIFKFPGFLLTVKLAAVSYHKYLFYIVFCWLVCFSTFSKIWTIVLKYMFYKSKLGKKTIVWVFGLYSWYLIDWYWSEKTINNEEFEFSEFRVLFLCFDCNGKIITKY